MTTRTIAGKTLEFDADGFLANPADWNETVANELAHDIGLDELTERHWTVIKFTRADFDERGEAPTLRRIKTVGGVPTKELYQLFPKKPAKKVAYVSGLGKPSGCI